MIQKTTLDFLKELNKNNAKEWFDANRAAYDDAKKDFLELIQQVINGSSLRIHLLLVYLLSRTYPIPCKDF